ncbi:MAG: hypothetical protein FP814_09945 [Desulfobacterium sp.]|nr:hypothetical protein [Desulfobacterium sp.]MBU3949743.1 hypothetical protein [Pseudomonadota bacterium]MBU4010349.1 hypothetical protein [Pseudomonadota bacterium]MBU4036650.1 hypothetical protein [Pseudomonadota bacterium]
MKKKIVSYFISFVFMLGISGCASYYKIVDPVSKKVYYSDSVDKKGNGAIQFKDEVSKNKVTLPQSEVMKVTEDQYKAETRPQ